MIDKVIQEKPSPAKDDIIFNLQDEEEMNKDGLTTGFSNKGFEPKRRTRKFKQDRTMLSSWVRE